jgi:hypothetical protein
MIKQENRQPLIPISPALPRMKRASRDDGPEAGVHDEPESVFTLQQNLKKRETRFWQTPKKCSRCAIISVHVATESVFTLRHNQCSRCNRISVHDGPEYAITGNKQVLPGRPREVAVRFRDQTIPEANTLQSRIPRVVLINSSISLI